MTKRAVLLALALALSAFASQASAQLSQHAMKFTFHDPCGGGNSASCADVMVGQGVFDASTVSTFIAALKYHSRDNKNPVLGQGVSTIIISSPGGSLSAGIALGLEIRRLRMNTTVVSSFSEWVRVKSGIDYMERPILQNAKCLSACSYAMLGGVKRSVESENALGVHQFNSTGYDQNLESNTQTTTAQLALYVNRMGVLPGFMTLASLTKPDEITYVSKGQARDLQVDNVNISLSPWRIKATEAGVPIMYVNQKISESHAVTIVLLQQGKTLIVSTQMGFKGEAMRATRLNEFPMNTTPEISFSVDGKKFRGQATRQWGSVNSPGVKIFESISEFPLSLLRAFQKAKTISISDDFPNAISDLSLATELSLNGLNSGALLLERSN